MPRAQTKHPLDPLSAAEIAVAVGTVRAAGATPEVQWLIDMMCMLSLFSDNLVSFALSLIFLLIFFR